MFCPSCGKEIKDGSKFCKYCGADIKSKKSSPQSSNSSDNSKIIIIGALIAVIVILAVVIGVFGFGLMDSGNNNVQIQIMQLVPMINLQYQAMNQCP